MRIFKLLALFMLLVLAGQSVIAGEGHTTLLATSDPFESGITADLFLETKPGTGKIFIESSPLTKIDTQISTRFAKEVACNYIGYDCSRLDFFYTIRANAAIIGGPSAGGAMAALTVAVLENVELNESVAVTGTINSGNVIGNVGGISEKLEAAKEEGIKKVLIPKGTVSTFGRNISIDVVEYGKELGIEVVEVFSLDEVMKEFTGKTFKPEEEDIEISEKYNGIMENLSSGLCQRTEDLSGNGKFAKTESFAEVNELAENLSRQGLQATNEGSYYAAASYCFGANVRYKYLDLISKNITDKEIAAVADEISLQITEFENNLENASTVSDAQILAVVLDRLAEARQHINVSREALNTNASDGSVFQLAFAIERLKSAAAWNMFFGVMNDSEISEDLLKNACRSKLGEAQERIEYASILIRSSSDGARARLGEAQRFFDTGRWAECLHKATISKSEANTLLSVMGVRDEEIDGIVERKIDAAQASIARQAKKEIFPIVGYSYYEYAKSLKDTDKYSALLFSDYALEFSNIDIYFKQTNSTQAFVNELAENTKFSLVIMYLIAGILIGSFLTKVAGGLGKKKKRILINRAIKQK